MEISTAIQKNFTDEEKRKSDSRVVFASFNDLLGKFQKLLDKNEEIFLMKTSAAQLSRVQSFRKSTFNSFLEKKVDQQKSFEKPDDYVYKEDDTGHFGSVVEE